MEENNKQTIKNTTQDQSDKTRAVTNSEEESKNRRLRTGARRPAGGRFNKNVKPEFANKIMNIRRVTRVMAGGRRFSFSVTLVAGDKKGRVGVGLGKASDTALAVEKALNDAKKKMITVPLTDAFSIVHDVKAKYNSAVITINPSRGKGLVAGSAVRMVLDHAGIKDVNAKILSRSKNKLNIGRATIEALKKLTV